MFGYHQIDKTMDEHIREIADLALSAQTLIILDTNILAYLYKLHEAARQEFFAWSDAAVLNERLAIPAWAASEYLSRVTGKNLESYTPKSKEPTQIKKALENLHQTAALFVDDNILHRTSFQGDRLAYINGFRAAIEELEKHLGVFKHQFDAGTIHQQIQDHLSTCILDSDLSSLCTRAAHEGAARFEHRMPPGFKDGNKDENPYGDLIIWYEILEKSNAASAQFPKVLFVTNDEKSDWVYAPKMRSQIVRDVRKSVGNSAPEIKIIDPRLVSEFKRKTGHPDITICTLATLIEGLSRSNGTEFSQLAAAIQVNTQELLVDTTVIAEVENEATAAPEEEVHIPEADAGNEIVAVEAPAMEEVELRLQYSQEALADALYQVDAPSTINEIIDELKSHNWYTQNPAMLKISSIRDEEFPPSSWFVLGRNIYQAACGNSQKAMEFMGNLESRLAHFPEETAKHMLAGMLFEIYFDAHGQFRETLKFGYAEKPLSLVTKQEYSDVVVFILSKLEPHVGRLKFLPGETARKRVVIISTPVERAEGEDGEEISELNSVTLDGIELMEDIPEPQGDGLWTYLLHTRTFYINRIRERISEELAIPKWALEIETAPPIASDRKLLIPGNRTFDPKHII
ncbi:PIN-like domain-containing protein [Pseudomonas alliivorans]|nr:PIN-like domain-containing protein [Pseudomonas alliivorans]MEE4778096.1 PIN-like domain-containing protein [Pseudomonas alliivorans]MEE5136419.1 PIN-like domain-containing protein [Pseudomonas alliivorans]